MYLDLAIAADMVVPFEFKELVRRHRSGALVWKDGRGYGAGYSDPGYGDWIAADHRWQNAKEAMAEARRLRASMFRGSEGERES